MFYAIWRNQKGEVRGFIVEEDGETPKAWKTEEEAKEAMRGHVLEHFCDIIEI